MRQSTALVLSAQSINPLTGEITTPCVIDITVPLIDHCEQRTYLLLEICTIYLRKMVPSLTKTLTW